MKSILAVVVPCYNEEEMLDYTAEKLHVKLNELVQQGKISKKSYIVFIDDGSRDQTWNKISRLSQDNSIFIGIKLSKNQGHQNALLAGLMSVKNNCDMCISIDADLQDDINCFDSMIDKFYEGNEIVYGVRNNRDKDSAFKKFTAQSYYKILSKLGANIVYNHADFRLMSNLALEGLSHFSEVNLFLRGLVPMIGYSSSSVYYVREERMAGESKYPLKKMVFFAFEGITSLSVSLLRFITFLGGIVSLISILMLIYILVRHFQNETISGWSSLIVSVWFLGGIILFSLGIIGEYVGKIYLETKRRPKYIIEEISQRKRADECEGNV
ncbi:glycosyltransferase family 2 protein [Enterococcus gilvus]|uniref:glycosyltransferase family 2 protein n=1 Tax=Enterococcus gilvus TaxID=160453 RepID=UPI001C8C3F4E|nr:glycosyltransferase family 2 protein [Enterococcus gilvus]MBX8937891.1 glycosyltransferase family 2 protein [Enterococcus gilvus]